MKYMGSKARFAKELAKIMLPADYAGKYVEPFAGGMNMMAEIPAEVSRTANDSNKYVIAMFRALLSGWIPPKSVTRDYYARCKIGECEDHMRGYVGINCSYSGKWFGGYAGVTTTKSGAIRDYQLEAYNNVMAQLGNLKGVKLVNLDYRELQVPDNSIVYCDSPYELVTGYIGKFDHKCYWDWVRRQAQFSKVYVSEYFAPDDFELVWSKQVSSSLSANGNSGGNKASIEKLFKPRGQEV